MPISGLPGLVDQAISHLRSQQRSPFTIQEIREVIQTELGNQLGDDALSGIKQIMHSRWGSGVEPAALGDELWQFGNSQPPVSREIRGR